MSDSKIIPEVRPTTRHLCILLAIAIVTLILWRFRLARETTSFVVSSMFYVAPIVVPGVLLAAWIIASGASTRIADIFHERTGRAVLIATAVGALSPVCGVTVLPLMAGLLAAGVPLAPVMAFWLASPITDPAMLSATYATLGWEFAVGKTFAAIGLGLLGGGVTSAVAQRPWVKSPLRTNRIVNALKIGCKDCDAGTASFDPFIWRNSAVRIRFARESWSITRLMLVVLTPAFAAEFLLNAWLQPNALAEYVGRESTFAVPLAVVIGGPAYIDGFAALPLTRTFLDHGMSPGAALAFLVSGGVVSIWGAMAIFPVLKLKPFMLYLALAGLGSMISGWVFDLI